MNHKNILTIVAFFLLALGCSHAQNGPNASGGEATGAGGTASFSVGQVVYTNHIGTNGNVVQGVQQPHEISILVGINKTTIHLDLSVYPNPTTNCLTLRTEDITDLYYQLLDAEGRIIENKKVYSNTTNIRIEGQTAGIYFLSVLKNNEIIKLFKVLKN